MLYNKYSADKYKADFSKKFSNFCNKSPVLLSFVTTESKVIVVHSNSKKSYDFPWDFTVPLKSFIFQIKQVLVENHYPRIVQVIKEAVTLSAEEKAQLLVEGTSPQDLPATKDIVTKRFWRIDRVVVYKDQFILVDEDTEEQYQYKMRKSCIFYLRNYRTGKYKSLEEAGEAFFNQSTLLNRIEPRV